jgi:hypothetical protein
MLQVFHVDVAKAELDVAKVDLDVANVVFECCGCYFLMFWNSSPCCCSMT